MNDTTRCYRRSLRDAFPFDSNESALGIAGPVVIPTRPSLLVRLLRRILKSHP